MHRVLSDLRARRAIIAFISPFNSGQSGGFAGPRFEALRARGGKVPGSSMDYGWILRGFRGDLPRGRAAPGQTPETNADIHF